MIKNFNPRDISWLSFNERVLQEAADKSVCLHQRIQFLSIFSNNLDEFFRVRVAGIKRAIELDPIEARNSFYDDPEVILKNLKTTVVQQQERFNCIWEKIQVEMAEENIFIANPKNLTPKQKNFVKSYFDNELEANILPLMLHDDTPMPYIRDKSLYLAVVMRSSEWRFSSKFALIEVPTQLNKRFVILPSEDKNTPVMLLEDVIAYNLPHIFSFFSFDHFSAHSFKLTKDADFDIDNDIKTSLVDKIAKGIKNRRKGKPTRFVFDKNMDYSILQFLIHKLNLTKKDSLLPGNKIHNFKDFMDFPSVFKNKTLAEDRKPFLHHEFRAKEKLSEVILKKDLLLSFPYHSFTVLIDFLREAAIDPNVKSISISVYRLARNSKIISTLINAKRNGKEVVVMMELTARFNEEDNLKWKEILELEGIKVLVGIPNMKVHAKLCIIKKRIQNKTIQYGFVSTGNFNEQSAKVYSDHCLLTSDRKIMADINKVFAMLKRSKPNPQSELLTCKNLLVCPVNMRNHFIEQIDFEIDQAQLGKKAEMIVKVNSLSDKVLIKKIYEAAQAGVDVKLIIRGIYCAVNQKRFKKKIHAISIVDTFLEHARVIYFYAAGNENTYISSADWMKRNLDYRIETAVRITSKLIKTELKEILDMQLKDNVKARILDEKLKNEYVSNQLPRFRSQIEIANYLKNKTK